MWYVKSPDYKTGEKISQTHTEGVERPEPHLQTKRSLRLETVQNDPEYPNNPHTDLKPLKTAYQTHSNVLAATHSTPASEL